MKTARQFHARTQTVFYSFLAGTVILGIVALLAPLKMVVAHAANSIPHPDHVVIVMEENHDYSQIIGDACCTYINAQAAAGALMTNSHGIGHPSQPNYLRLFSGFDQGVTDSTCPLTFSTPNLGQELIDAGLSFGSYSEDLPATGSTICNSGQYARRHNPWVNFSNVPTSTNMPFTSFPSDFTQLPTVSIVVPNLCNDMHDCSPATGDAWLASHLDAYAQWATTHNSLLIIHFDEDSNAGGNNQVATIFAGPMVNPGHYNEDINHYNILRTLEDMYGLPYAGESANVAPITDIWSGAAIPTLTRTPTRISKIVSFENGVLPGSGYTGTRDTVIKQGNASVNYANEKILHVDGDDGSGFDKSILIRWDTATIPTNAVVTKATLTFWVADTSTNAYRLYRMKRNWVEYQSTWKVFATGQKWQITGALGANDRGVVLGTAGPAASVGFYTVTLNASGLSLVQSWVNHPSANFGLLIANAAGSDALGFDSSEASVAWRRPRLTITYH